MKHFLLFCLCIIGLATTGSAQISSYQIPKVRLSNIDTIYTTYDRILQNPRLVTGAVNCNVTEFTISFTVKDGPTYGPYPTRGFMLTDEAKIAIKNLRNEKVRILVQHINMKCDEQNVQPQDIVLYFNY